MRFINIPAKVLACSVSTVAAAAYWPYPESDPFWAGGSSPKPYQWQIHFTVTAQLHSSRSTRAPLRYDGMDVFVGDYIADQQSGIALKIVSVVSKTSTDVTCIVEDVLRYNTFRNPSQTGQGIFNIPTQAVVFEVNEDYKPVVDPAPSSGVGSTFYSNLMSRFQNLEQEYNYMLYKPAHGFVIDQVVAADPANNSFALADAEHPFALGTVSYTDLGPDYFMIDPFQKVVDGYDALPGSVANVLYADPSNPGALTTTAGGTAVMIKLQDYTQTMVTGTVMNPTTASNNVLVINTVSTTVANAVSNVVTIADFVTAVNANSAVHGVTASEVPSPTVVSDNINNCTYGQPALMTNNGPYATATINGVLVTFKTTTEGERNYQAPYSLEEDMAADINAANIPGIVASTSPNVLTLTNTNGGPITIVNGAPDTQGNYFAGNNSGSGLPLSTPASTGEYLKLTAVDARAIELYDVVGTPSADMGVVSAENGQKAAALYIEQGIRQASSYVVANIAARDALHAMFGDQCFVQDAGNGEWAHYIMTLGNTWVQLTDQDSSNTDAYTVEVTLTANSAVTATLASISSGRRVTFVTVTVQQAFDGAGASISLGDSGDNARLMTVDQSDLSAVGDYSTTPSYTYETGGPDTDINYYFEPANSTVGSAIVAITYT